MIIDTLNKKYKYIYKITNLVNNMIYVGQHATNKEHEYYKGSGIRLREAKRKYGTFNFKKEILEWYEGNSKKEFNELERSWIKKLSADNPAIGYNLTDNCGGGYINKDWYEQRKGIKLSEETKRKISESNKGKIVLDESKRLNSEKHKGRVRSNKSIEQMKETKGYICDKDYKYKQIKKIRYRIINQYDLEGNFIRQFNSLTEAAIFLGKIPERANSSLRKAALNFKYTAYGYKWKYDEDQSMNLIRHVTYDPQRVKHECKKKIRKINQYDLRGTYIKTFDSAADACREIGLTNTNDIHLVCKGIRFSAKGYLWKYD